MSRRLEITVVLPRREAVGFFCHRMRRVPSENNRGPLDISYARVILSLSLAQVHKVSDRADLRTDDQIAADLAIDGRDIASSQRGCQGPSLRLCHSAIQSQ
jgi:hypothetical protein